MFGGVQLCVGCGRPLVASGSVFRQNIRFCGPCSLRKLQSDKVFKKVFLDKLFDLGEESKRKRFVAKLER